ncbi:MAG: hypothetical protein FWC03_06360 [Treponema sp.]|nr:hypothetical protein [Treponema sp.]
MKKYFLSLIFLLNSLLIIYGQNAQIQNYGSAKSLEGNVYVLVCFISGSNNSWSYNEKLDWFKKYYEAVNWIKDQALNYNVAINFQGGNFGMNADIKLDYGYGTGSGNEDVSMVSKVLREIGYRDSLSFYEFIVNNTNCDNALILIAAKGRGRSYAIACEFSTEDLIYKELHFMEGVMLYDYNEDGNEILSSGIAHELLHLFGAWDLYENFMQSNAIEELALYLFPNSIMLRISQNINELIIDPVTAWLIGWNKYPEPWYDAFNPYSKIR